jgi:hypothetical protein
MGMRTVVASTTESSSSNSSQIQVPVGRYNEITLLVDGTAETALTSIDFHVEWLVGSNWVGALADDQIGRQLTALPDGTFGTFTIKGEAYRVVWTINGTDATFSVSEYTSPNF